MERGLLLAFEVDYSHRDKLTLKLSYEYSHYTRCNELYSEIAKTNIELRQIKETFDAKSCEGYSRYHSGYS